MGLQGTDYRRQSSIRVLDDVSDVAMLIARRRSELGWTQRTAAERSGMSVTAFVRIENQLRIPSIGQLQRIGKAMGLSVQIKVEPLTVS